MCRREERPYHGEVEGRHLQQHNRTVTLLTCWVGVVVGGGGGVLRRIASRLVAPRGRVLRIHLLLLLLGVASVLGARRRQALAPLHTGVGGSLGGGEG